MRAIKILVAIMSLLLILGLVLLGYGMFSKAGEMGQKEAARPPAAAPAVELAPTAPLRFGDVALSLPAGSRFEQMAVAGGRVVLLYSQPAGGQRLVVLDPASGAVAGQLSVSIPRE